jgi:hypothetical protein
MSQAQPGGSSNQALSGSTGIRFLRQSAWSETSSVAYGAFLNDV